MGPIPVSVVIAAHDEGAVLGTTLDHLLREAAPGELDVVVAANGCSDDTAEVARRRPGVRVVELGEAGKARALAAAEELTLGFPRLYLDADIRLGVDEVRRLAAALGPGILAVTGRRVVDTAGRPWAVRGYYATSALLGAFEGHLYGRGAVMLSREGRGRFATFPLVVADDLFLDSLFAPGETRELPDVVCRVEAPRTTSALVRRLVRVRRGNAALREELGAQVRPRRRTGDVLARTARSVVRSPGTAPAALAYLTLTAWVGLRARASRRPVDWGQDRSTRAGALA